MNQLDTFGQHVQQDPELQERLEEAESAEALVERVLTEAKALGYDLDAEDIRQRIDGIRGDAELSDAELDTIAGGATRIMPYCCSL